MPFAFNQSTRIHYQVHGQGPALVLLHGTLGTIANWKEAGYIDPLGRDSQLILIDARGHGDSDKPHDPSAYDLDLRVGDVVAVLDDLGIQQADYFGYSMGGWIGYGLAKYAPHRFRSLIIGGCHPFEESMQLMRDALALAPSEFLAVAAKMQGPYLTPEVRTRLLANDFKALIALSQDRPSLADVLPTITMPCLLLVGEDDPRLQGVREAAGQLPTASLLTLPNCNHIAAFYKLDVIIPRVTNFLQGVRKN